MTAKNCIETKDLVKTFAGGKTTAVDHLSLTIEKGQTVGLSGADGAGKTTLLRLIGGLLLPDAGKEHAFETSIDLPCQEAVSLIAVQVIPDPGTWMMSDVVSKLHELQVQSSSDDAAGAEHSQSRPQSLKEFAEDWENRWAEWEWMDDHDR